MNQTATENKLAKVIMNGQKRINTAWGQKSVVGIANMFERYASERLVMGVFVQQEPLDVFCTLVNKFGYIDNVPLGLLEYFIEYLEIALENKPAYEALSILKERVTNQDKKFGRKPKTDHFWQALTGTIDMFTYLFRADDRLRGSDEHKAALQEILQRLKDKV